jgi:hypothetical protein
MLVSEKFFKKSIRKSIYVSIRENFLRRVSEKAFMLVLENFFKKSIRESIYVSIREIF